MRFPAPLEGMGGFLQITTEFRQEVEWTSFRPLSRYGWVPTFSGLPGDDTKYTLFPAPLEVWVGSYENIRDCRTNGSNCFRPLSRYGWFPTYSHYSL